jgi:hypothetical protein
MARVVLLLLLAGCAREWVRDYDGYLPGTDYETACVFLVRDARTGKPIPNATVTQHPEWWIDEDGNWAPEWARTKTDRYGLAWFVFDEKPWTSHWAVRADGYSPEEEFGEWVQEEIELDRGWEEAGRLLSYDGTPLVGALVEYKTGCAHAPALLTTRTDRDGLFVFRDVTGGDLPFEHPRCAAEYWGGYRTRPRALGVPTYTAEPGFTITGRVVEPDGTPPAWCALSTTERGARAKTDADGRFVLRRTYPGATIHLWHDGDLVTFESEHYRPGGPLLIRLQEPQPALGATERVVVKLAGEPEWSLDVHLDRISDGRRFTVRVDPGDAAEFKVPAGAYLLSAGDPFSRYRAADRRVVVQGPTETTLEVHEQPRVRSAGEAGLEDWFRYSIVLPDRMQDTELGEPVYVPADGPAWLRISIERDVYTFPIDPPRDGVRFVRIRVPGLKRIRIGADEAYLEYAGYEYANGVLETYAVGRQHLVVIHEGRGRAERELDLTFDEAERDLELDDLGFVKREEKEKTLRVVDAQSRPVAAWVDLPLAPPPWSEDESDAGPTDAEGYFRSTALRDDVPIRIRPVGTADFVPLATTLHGDGPYEVRLGSATIVVEARGLEDASVVLDGEAWRYPDDDGRFVLRGVTEGPHDLLVGAQGRIGKAYRLVLKEGETRRLAPDLRPR